MNNHVQSAEEIEEAATKRASARLRFKQQIFVGVGGAILFALVGSVGTSLLHTATASIAGGSAFMSAAVLGPVLGLVGIAVLGLGCLYLGSHYLSEVISLDQNTEAKKICEAQSKGAAPTVTPTIEHEASPLPTSMGASELDQAEQPSTKVQAASVQLLSTPERAPAAEQANATWTERTAANDSAPQLTQVGA